MADTDLQQLVINVGTKAQIEAAIAGGTITQDMLSFATDGDIYIQGVKVNGTELTPDSNNKVDVTVPTDTGDLTNNAGYITSSALTGYATQTWVGQQGYLTSTALSGYATEQWVQNQGYLTGITSSDVTTALGYTPYNSSNPSGYQANVIETVKVNGSALTPSNKAVDITVPTQASDIGAQATLVSGTNIKTINGNSLLGSGNLSLDGLPSQTGNAGKFLTTDGTDASWGVPKTHDLFDHKWEDYLLNDQSWLRADTISWQDGTVYTNAYNHLVDDNEGATEQSETIGSYTIYYRLASDGHKIVMPDQETTVANIYNATGVAWYYILDTANQRFKLPRTKFGFTGLRDTVGKYVEAGLPSLSLYTPNSNDKYGSQLNTIYSVGGTSGTTNNIIGTNQSYKLYVKDDNNIVGNSTTVQPPATQMYLYFYVGQFSQSATEQTAGLNSELFNGKADVDMGNVSSAGKETIVGWGMPDYSAGITKSATSYTETTNGFIVVDYTSDTDSRFRITIDGVEFRFYQGYSGTDYEHCNVGFVPIPNGKQYTINYIRNCRVRFFPCLGG